MFGFLEAESPLGFVGFDLSEDALAVTLRFFFALLLLNKIGIAYLLPLESFGRSSGLLAFAFVAAVVLVRFFGCFPPCV